MAGSTKSKKSTFTIDNFSIPKKKQILFKLFSRNDVNKITPSPTSSLNYEKYDDNANASQVLKVSNLCKTYDGDHQALKNVSFHLNGGECFGLLGANGAGKSTIFSILSGQLYQTAGTVQFHDNKGISYCPQTNALDPLLTVQEVIHFYGTLRKVSDLQAVSAIEFLLSLIRTSANFVLSAVCNECNVRHLS